EPGRYAVRAHFAEIHSAGVGPGERVFDVLAENRVVLPSFDIAREAGAAMTAVRKSFEVEVYDGQLDLRLRRIASSPKISGIEIFPLERVDFGKFVAARVNVGG